MIGRLLTSLATGAALARESDRLTDALTLLASERPRSDDTASAIASRVRVVTDLGQFLVTCQVHSRSADHHGRDPIREGNLSMALRERCEELGYTPKTTTGWSFTVTPHCRG